MKIELSEINKLNLNNVSLEIYKLKYDNPKHPVSTRCFDFKGLETAALKYNIKHNNISKVSDVKKETLEMVNT
jgi:hypothetical protein